MPALKQINLTGNPIEKLKQDEIFQACAQSSNKIVIKL